MTTRQKLFAKNAAAAVAGAAITLAMLVPGAFAHADSAGGTGVFIGSNGVAYVRAASVTATSTAGLTATTNLAGNVITWNAIATSTTLFGKLGTGTTALLNVAVGDVVSFFGKLSGSGSNLTVEAQAVHDRTYAKAHATSSGAIKQKRDRGLHLGWGKFWGRFHGSLNADTHGKDGR